MGKKYITRAKTYMLNSKTTKKDNEHGRVIYFVFICYIYRKHMPFQPQKNRRGYRSVVLLVDFVPLYIRNVKKIKLYRGYPFNRQHISFGSIYLSEWF